ncbi:MAG: hypothetical protein EOP82_08435 [Variovorax sp.]|nr:MAG: hypothetical protein EOP82_08435 [Variovorax sp.]
MRCSTRLFAVAAAAMLASMGAIAQTQETTDGSDYHPLMMNSPERPDVQAGAVAASHPAATELEGQSTAAPSPASNVSSAEVQAGAVAAAHASGTELWGQSTSPMPPSGNTH